MEVSVVLEHRSQVLGCGKAESGGTTEQEQRWETELIHGDLHEGWLAESGRSGGPCLVLPRTARNGEGENCYLLG